MTRKIQTISLFPQMFSAILNESMMFKAQDRGIVEFRHGNLRDFGVGPRKQVDDTPYGGGDGMLLKPEPLFAAVEQAKQTDPDALVCLMTPRGTTWSQPQAEELAIEKRGLIFICARYEGYDERITTVVDRQVSIGNYVLTGGELPALVVIDSIVRLLPGVLGGETSAAIESFSNGNTLEFPQYTRPAEFQGLQVPEVLLNGNHAAIAKWRETKTKSQSE
ncbi:MAG TPA: tRNA (guanosine(37)-N1)-methyltransferase TrmD [Candidatus Saccharimonadales bacterium]